MTTCFATVTSEWCSPGLDELALTPEQFTEPGATLYFMDGKSGYQGSYVNPPFWAYTYAYWPLPAPGQGWWETPYASQRHDGDFNAAFMDGHVASCAFDECYDVGPDSRSVRYWGTYAN